MVEGRVLQTSDYCGGAMPTPEMLASIRKPSPLANQTVHFRRGSKNTVSKPLASAQSDEQGHLEVHLPPGTYCVVSDEKSKPQEVPPNDANSTWDRACLKRDWARCDAVVKVAPNKPAKFEITLAHHCPWTRPCLQYRGPLPP